MPKVVPGYRIGQAANLAHDYLVSKGLPEGKTLEEAWEERTGMYIAFLDRMDEKFSNLPEPPAQKSEEIPVILDMGEEDSTN